MPDNDSRVVEILLSAVTEDCETMKYGVIVV